MCWAYIHYRDHVRIIFTYSLLRTNKLGFWGFGVRSLFRPIRSSTHNICGVPNYHEVFFDMLVTWGTLLFRNTHLKDIISEGVDLEQDGPLAQASEQTESKLRGPTRMQRCLVQVENANAGVLWIPHSLIYPRP